MSFLVGLLIAALFVGGVALLLGWERFKELVAAAVAAVIFAVQKIVRLIDKARQYIRKVISYVRAQGNYAIIETCTQLTLNPERIHIDVQRIPINEVPDDVRRRLLMGEELRHEYIQNT